MFSLSSSQCLQSISNFKLLHFHTSFNEDNQPSVFKLGACAAWGCLGCKGSLEQEVGTNECETRATLGSSSSSKPHGVFFCSKQGWPSGNLVSPPLWRGCVWRHMRSEFHGVPQPTTCKIPRGPTSPSQVARGVAMHGMPRLEAEAKQLAERLKCCKLKTQSLNIGGQNV